MSKLCKEFQRMHNEIEEFNRNYNKVKENGNINLDGGKIFLKN